MNSASNRYQLTLSMDALLLHCLTTKRYQYANFAFFYWPGVYPLTLGLLWKTQFVHAARCVREARVKKERLRPTSGDPSKTAALKLLSHLLERSFLQFFLWGEEESVFLSVLS